jgi:hypothetical protein
MVPDTGFKIPIPNDPNPACLKFGYWELFVVWDFEFLTRGAPARALIRTAGILTLSRL